jgi:hypothetical protein
MPTLETYEWSEEVLGDRIAYCGHPVVIACMIMDRFENLTHARTSDRAVKDCFISGAGCAVRAALDAIDIAIKRGHEAAYQYTSSYWDNYARNSGSNQDPVLKGRAQFELLKESFEKKVACWRAGLLVESKFRVDASCAIG